MSSRLSSELRRSASRPAYEAEEAVALYAVSSGAAPAAGASRPPPSAARLSSSAAEQAMVPTTSPSSFRSSPLRSSPLWHMLHGPPASTQLLSEGPHSGEQQAVGAGALAAAGPATADARSSLAEGDEEDQLGSLSDPQLSMGAASEELLQPLLRVRLSGPSQQLQQSRQSSQLSSHLTGLLSPRESSGAWLNGFDSQPPSPLPPLAADGSSSGRGQHSCAQLSRATVFGLINTVAGVPTLIAFCAIVFKHPVYAPWLPTLCKFFYLASAIDQLVACLGSRLPHIVAQVQDVGLIFLSSMATSIASDCLSSGLDAAAALATTLATCAISTLLVGLGMLAVAKFKLAQAVEYVPLPVVAGYLSYVGFFCMAGGLSLGVGKDMSKAASWIFMHQATAAKLAATLAACASMMLVTSRCSHPAALPALLLAINAVFWAVLLAAGGSLKGAEASGWVMKPQEGGHVPFWELWGLLYNTRAGGPPLTSLHLPAMLRQAGKLAGLFLVVTFGSAMDVAAIQQATPEKLDFDGELSTIGLFNVICGLVGAGFTGSYIFSQTIFTSRGAVFSRVNGLVIAAAELALFALPGSIVQFLPTFFTGALLLWFGAEISKDWLYRSFWKLTGIEYLLMWLTFGTICWLGLEGGIGIGCILAVFYFALAYARSSVRSFNIMAPQSSIVRAAEPRAALSMLCPTHLAAAQMRGFIFFGTANSLGRRLLAVAAALRATADASAAAGSVLFSSGSKHGKALYAIATAPKFMILDFSQAKGLDATGARVFGVLFRDLQHMGITSVVTGVDHHAIRKLLVGHGAPLSPTPLQQPEPGPATALPTPGGDPGSAAGGLSPGEPLGLGPEESRQFLLDGRPLTAWEPPPACLEFADLEAALRYCEGRLLQVAVRYGLCRPPTAAVTLQDLLTLHLTQGRDLGLAPASQAGALAEAIARYMSRRAYRAGDVLWHVGEPSDQLLYIEQGSVAVDQYSQLRATEGAMAAAAAEGQAQGGSPSALSNPLAERLQQARLACVAAAAGVPNGTTAGEGGCSGQQEGRPVVTRSFEFGPGTLLGAVDFYLQQPHTSTAVCLTSCRLLSLPRRGVAQMAAEDPQALHVWQVVVLRSKYLDLSAALKLS